MCSMSIMAVSPSLSLSRERVWEHLRGNGGGDIGFGLGGADFILIEV